MGHPQRRQCRDFVVVLFAVRCRRRCRTKGFLAVCDPHGSIYDDAGYDNLVSLRAERLSVMVRDTTMFASVHLLIHPANRNEPDHGEVAATSIRRICRCSKVGLIQWHMLDLSIHRCSAQSYDDENVITISYLGPCGVSWYNELR